MREKTRGPWLPMQWRALPPPLALHVASHGGTYAEWWHEYRAEVADVYEGAREHLRPGGEYRLQSDSTGDIDPQPCSVCSLPVGQFGEPAGTHPIRRHAHCSRNAELGWEVRLAAGRLGAILSHSRRHVPEDILWLYWSSRPVLSILTAGKRGGVSIPMAHLSEWCRLRDAGLVCHLGGHEFAPVDPAITGWLPKAAYSQAAAKRGGQCLVCREMIPAGDPAIFRPGGYGRRSGLIHPACASAPKSVDRIAELEAEIARLRGERV